MIPPRGEAHFLGRINEEFRTGGVGCGDAVEKFAFDLGIGAHGQVFVSRTLHGTRTMHAFGGGRTSFRGWRESEILRGDRGDLDMDVDAVEQRA